MATGMFMHIKRFARRQDDCFVRRKSRFISTICGKILYPSLKVNSLFFDTMNEKYDLSLA